MYAIALLSVALLAWLFPTVLSFCTALAVIGLVVFLGWKIGSKWAGSFGSILSILFLLGMFGGTAWGFLMVIMPL